MFDWGANEFTPYLSQSRVNVYLNRIESLNRILYNFGTQATSPGYLMPEIIIFTDTTLRRSLYLYQDDKPLQHSTFL